MEQDEKVQDDVKEVEVENGVKFNEALEENPRHEEVACTEKDKKNYTRKKMRYFLKIFLQQNITYKKRLKPAQSAFRTLEIKIPHTGDKASLDQCGK